MRSRVVKRIFGWQDGSATRNKRTSASWIGTGVPHHCRNSSSGNGGASLNSGNDESFYSNKTFYRIFFNRKWEDLEWECRNFSVKKGPEPSRKISSNVGRLQGEPCIFCTTLRPKFSSSFCLKICPSLIRLFSLHDLRREDNFCKTTGVCISSAAAKCVLPLPSEEQTA